MALALALPTARRLATRGRGCRVWLVIHRSKIGYGYAMPLRHHRRRDREASIISQPGPSLQAIYVNLSGPFLLSVVVILSYLFLQPFNLP